MSAPAEALCKGCCADISKIHLDVPLFNKRVRSQLGAKASASVTDAQIQAIPGWNKNCPKCCSVWLCPPDCGYTLDQLKDKVCEGIWTCKCGKANLHGFIHLGLECTEEQAKSFLCHACTIGVAARQLKTSEVQQRSNSVPRPDLPFTAHVGLDNGHKNLTAIESTKLAHERSQEFGLGLPNFAEEKRAQKAAQTAARQHAKLEQREEKAAQGALMPPPPSRGGKKEKRSRSDSLDSDASGKKPKSESSRLESQKNIKNRKMVNMTLLGVHACGEPIPLERRNFPFELKDAITRTWGGNKTVGDIVKDQEYCRRYFPLEIFGENCQQYPNVQFCLIKPKPKRGKVPSYNSDPMDSSMTIAEMGSAKDLDLGLLCKGYAFPESYFNQEFIEASQFASRTQSKRDDSASHSSKSVATSVHHDKEPFLPTKTTRERKITSKVKEEEAEPLIDLTRDRKAPLTVKEEGVPKPLWDVSPAHREDLLNHLIGITAPKAKVDKSEVKVVDKPHVPVMAQPLLNAPAQGLQPGPTSPVVSPGSPSKRLLVPVKERMLEPIAGATSYETVEIVRLGSDGNLAVTGTLQFALTEEPIGEGTFHTATKVKATSPDTGEKLLLARKYLRRRTPAQQAATEEQHLREQYEDALAYYQVATYLNHLVTQHREAISTLTSLPANIKAKTSAVNFVRMADCFIARSQGHPKTRKGSTICEEYLSAETVCEGKFEKLSNNHTGNTVFATEIHLTGQYIANMNHWLMHAKACMAADNQGWLRDHDNGMVMTDQMLLLAKSERAARGVVCGNGGYPGMIAYTTYAHTPEKCKLNPFCIAMGLASGGKPHTPLDFTMFVDQTAFFPDLDIYGLSTEEMLKQDAATQHIKLLWSERGGVETTEVKHCAKASCSYIVFQQLPSMGSRGWRNLTRSWSALDNNTALMPKMVLASWIMDSTAQRVKLLTDGLVPEKYRLPSTVVPTALKKK